MRYTAELCRTFRNDKQVLGQIDVLDENGIVFTCFSLELPDLNHDGITDNERRESCILEGIYKIKKENHKKFGWCYRVYDVPNRDGVLIHAGVNFTHTLGCILPATNQKDLNKDGELDNTESKKALAKLVEYDLNEINIYYRQ